MARFLARTFGAVLAIVALSAVLVVGAVAATMGARGVNLRLPTKKDITVLIERQSFQPPKPSQVIYLERNALSVRGGVDNARQKTTSIVAKGETQTIPRYRAANATWQRLVTCVQKKFADFDVTVTDKLPMGEDYVLVKVGGQPKDLGMKGRKIGGIAPFTGHPMPNSIVFAFDQGGRYRTRNNCETVAHEVGHVYGLDHTDNCKDIMSYKHGCGPKTFVDAQMMCGEKDNRECERGGLYQNSASGLEDVLGARTAVATRRTAQ